MPANRGGLYPVLPSWWDEYECSYLLFVQTPLFVSYYCGRVLRGGSNGTRRVITLAISEFAVLTSIQL